jgi:PAS domain S-box-containing protein
MPGRRRPLAAPEASAISTACVETRHDATWEILSTHINDLIILADTEGRIFYASPSCQRLGYTQQDLIGRNAADFAHPEDLARSTANVAALFAGEVSEAPADRELRYRRKDGQYVWLQGSPSLLPDGRGGCAGLINVFRDVTEQRAVRERLVESEHRYRLIAENATDMISQTSCADGRLTYLSPSVERMTGYSAAELVGQRMQDFVHPDDKAEFMAAFEGLITDRRERGRPIRFRALHKNGTWLWLESNPRLVRGPDGKVADIIDVTRDVGEREALEERLREAVTEAEKSAQVKTEFLANMSHEIRTPLTAVLGFTGLLAERGDLPGEARGYVDRISGASRALLAIVNDVLDFSKLEAGQVTITPTPTDTARAAREVLEMFEPQAEAKGLELRFEARSGLPARAWVDAGRLRQILVNLIGNAVKFTDHGTVAVRLEYEPEAEMLVAEIADTGPGIASAARDKLFERFSQVDGSSTRANGGTGLGLAICRRLAQAMGGAVSLRSRVGYGSTFRVELPARPAEAALEGDAAVGEAEGLEGLRVLVADDNAANRELARAILAQAGVEVSEAHGGEEAVQMAETLPVDLILMDLRMPGLGGCAAAQAIRLGEGPNRDIPILAFSADYDLSEGRRGTLPLFNGQVRKPVSPAELIEAVRAAVSEAPEAAQEALYVRA